jgi:hypothetical protein
MRLWESVVVAGIFLGTRVVVCTTWSVSTQGWVEEDERV